MSHLHEDHVQSTGSSSSSLVSAPKEETQDNGSSDETYKMGARIAMGIRTNPERRMTALELQDCEDALEHAVIAGNHYRHRAWRINTWKQLQLNMTNSEATISGGNEGNRGYSGEEESNPPEDKERKKASRKRKRDDSDGKTTSDDDDDETTEINWNAIHLLHGEDIRLYGHADGFAADPWPRDLRGGHHNRYKHRFDSAGMDAPWEEEFGDAIPALELTRDRLSGVAPSNPCTTEIDNQESQATSCFVASKETEDLLVPERMRQLDPDTVRCTVDRQDVPKAILLRCWQRAVDIASHSTLQSSVCSVHASAAQAKGKEIKFHNNHAESTRQMQVQKSAKQRCQDLAIEKYPWGAPMEPPYKCRLCTADFASMDALENHFYGSNDVRGCSWSEIHTKQRQMISDVLVKEVESQAQALVQLVMNKALGRVLANQAPNSMQPKTDKQASSSPVAQPKQPDLFSWKDVLGFLYEAMASSQDCAAAGDESSGGSSAKDLPEIRKTLRYQGGLAPLVLNQQVLQASSSWLIERYANLPK